MRATLGLAAMASLIGCDTGGVVDQTIREGVGQSAVQACTAWVAQTKVAVAAAVDADKICACAADRILEGKSLSELTELRPESAEVRSAVLQCVAEYQTSSPQGTTS